MTDEEFKGAAEATAHDHLRSMLSLMARGARINLSGIPGDPTFLSSNISGETAQELAALISVQFGRGYMAALDDVESDAKAALPSGVRVKPCDPRECICSPDDDPPVECPFPQPRGTVNIKPLEWLDMGEGPRCITVCGMYAIHPSSGTNGKPTLTLTGMPGNLFGKFATVEEAKAAAQADYERRVLSAIEPTPSPSHAETVDPYAAALRMIRDAVGELFGPVSDLESEEAVLLRGPEPHHEAEAIIAGMRRVKGHKGYPAAAELERYSLHHVPANGKLLMLQRRDGDWVKYTDAQAAIAAKDGRIDLAETTMVEMHRDLSATEARVAELEKALDELLAYSDVDYVPNNAFAKARAALHPEREG